MNIVDIAESVARTSTMRQKHSAIIYIFKRNTPRIISFGVNRWAYRGNNGRIGWTKYSRHAEADAILRCHDRRLFPKSHIYVHRVGGKLAKPCDCCMSLIEMVGISENNIHWSGNDGNL